MTPGFAAQGPGCALVGALLLAGCLAMHPALASGARSPAATEPGAPPTRIFFDSIDRDGTLREVEWHWPGAPAVTPPQALVLLQHGFARRCERMRALGQALAAAGLAALCIGRDPAGDPSVPAAQWLADLGEGPDHRTPVAPVAALPDGQPLPRRWIVAGHSAGASVMIALAASLVIGRAGDRAPAGEPGEANGAPARPADGEARPPAGAPTPGPADRPLVLLAGVLLLDPVWTRGEAAALPLLETVLGRSEAPVLALVAPPGPCNLQARAAGTLESLSAARPGRITVARFDRGTHVDAEGWPPDALAAWLCRQGPPDASTVAEVLSRAARAAAGMAGDEPAQPPARRKGPTASSKASGASSGM